MATSKPRIAFVNPSVGFSDRRKSKPIGLAYIMAYLRENGYESDGYDFGDSLEDPLALAEQHGFDRYDIIGFSVYNESFVIAAKMAAWVKERNPGALVVVGGPHATAVHAHIAKTYPCFDVVVRREGEQTMLEIVRKAGDPAALRAIVGTTHPAAAGEPLVNPDRDAILQLDELPFPDAHFTSHSGYPPMSYYDAVQGRVKDALAVCSSRSCPFDCSFCGVLTIGRKYRSREAMRVVDELMYFRQRDGKHYEHIYFTDANFFVSAKRALEIAELLHEADPQLTFSFGTRVNQILRAKDLLPRLKECGLRFIEMGIESASPAVLERLAKRVKPETNVAAVKLLRSLGIKISLDFIMLDPASTLDDVAANMEFLRSTGFYDYVPHEHLYSALVLYEGTPIRKYYEERMGVTFDPDLLPPPHELYEQPDVQRFSNELRAFSHRYQGRIEEALVTGERALLTVTAGPELALDRQTVAQLQLDLVALRHAPNLFIENLLADAKNGFAAADAAGTDGLLPTLSYDRVALTTLLERVVALGTAVENGLRAAPVTRDLAVAS